MLMVWFIACVIVTTIAAIGTSQDSLAFIKDFRRHAGWAIFAIAINLLYIASIVLGIMNLVGHYDYDGQEVRCSSIEGSSYDRKNYKCYVNGEER